MSRTDEMILESKEDVELAKTAQRCIIASLDHSRAPKIALIGDAAQPTSGAPLLELPPKVLRLFADLLGTLAKGKAVTIVPKDLDFSTQQAAMFLNVSRPYLIRLLEEGKIPFHMVGTHRRILFEDVVTYKEKRRATSQAALQRLADQAQDLDMGY